MTSEKRIIIATLLGTLFGLVCMLLASSGGSALPEILKLQIVVSRTMLGFVIGISAIKMNWAVHGIIMGLLIGLPMALASTLGTEGTEFTPQSMFFSTLLIGAIYGFLIELITSVVFKARQRRV
jgi:hypothetical protein